jgi:hypothetical protein
MKMKRIATLVMLAALVFGCAAFAAAATEVKMTGDARIWGNFWEQQNFTGWTPKGTSTYDALTIWERFRLRTDFIANEGLKFRLGIRVNNKAWGNDTFTVDNPAASIDVYQAFLQFKWPSTDVEFTVGLQDMDLPISAPSIFNSSPVLGGTRSAAAVVAIPVADQFKIIGGFTRLLDTNKDFDPTTTQKADELDGYFLALPITLDGFSATPWGLIGVAGRDAGYFTAVGASPRMDNQSLATNLLSAGTLAGAPATVTINTTTNQLNNANLAIKNAQNMFWWAGTTLAVTALDPFKFYGDFIYGQGNFNDRKKNERSGWFADQGFEYTGLDMLTPQLSFWYSTGEDKSTGNGSERMPTIVQSWGPSTSFLFDSSQAFGAGTLAVNPIGSFGAAFSLNKMSFIQDLTHRLTFTYAHGDNSPRALRNANALWGVGTYVQMGRDLTWNESVYSVNFDNQYNIYENLAAIVETGWAHGDSFQKSVWGRRFVNQAASGDVWKVAFGLQYKF